MSIATVKIVLNKQESVSRLKYTSADVAFDEQKLYSVYLRLKGNGSFQSITQKPSLTLKSEWKDRSAFHNWRKIHLNNSIQDESYLRPFIAYQLFSAVGYPVPQVELARVQMNNRDLGIYVMT